MRKHARNIGQNSGDQPAVEPRSSRRSVDIMKSTKGG